ncbi:DEAD/DEAH box helicase [Streptomyces sp. NRRL S-350]|uniref:DEAD/DEAH box helicase n=1 Tax=Streptomyces sp. NRRL S-350 TaxID=1463902 RepID=UPI00068E98AE|nr:DEAD/DEAH box helicase [Streptomyces sp. NRRL S-350]
MNPTVGQQGDKLSEQAAADLASARALAEAVIPGRRPVPPKVRIAPMRDYQRRAVSAAYREVRHGGRAILEMACGAGKTLVSANCAKRLARYGRVLVLMPTIELLEQTARSWSSIGGRTGTAIAACSKEEALESAEAGGHVEGHVTTDAAELSDLIARVPAGKPVTVYATYASLERIVKAHEEFRLPGWDLVIIDEAHRTAGALDKTWAAVHKDAKVPAERRLYFTATPRIADEPAEGDLSDLVLGSSRSLYSMDDEEVFGRTVFRWTFEEGVTGGWIADYQIIVPVVTDEDLRQLLSLPAVSDLRSQRTNEDLQRLALQVAVLRAIADLGLRRVISFHARIDYARKFAASLVETADLLPDYDRPERIWAKAVAGTDPRRIRQAAFDEFRAHTGLRPGEEGEECGILCNARLLAEGIDMPTVDAIVFADPKTSPVDIVQALGRAVRQAPNEGKTAYVIIPVYIASPDHEAGDDEADDLPVADPAIVTPAGPQVQEEADAAIQSSAFRSVLHVLRALASVDSRVVGRIADLRTHRSQPGTTFNTGPVRLTAAAPQADAEDSGPQDETVATETEAAVTQPADPIEWLRIKASAHAAEILRSLKLRMFSPRTQEWERMWARAAEFYIEHHHLDVTDKDRHQELITWLGNQRYLREQGTLDAARVSELNAIGMIWDKHAHAWARGAAYATAYQKTHDHLAAKTKEQLDGYNIGRWLERQRKADNLTPEQNALLDALDPLWRLEPDWNRSYRRLVAYLAAGGTLDGPVNRTGVETDPTFRPGSWLRKQDKARSAGALTTQQISLLDALHEQHGGTAPAAATSGSEHRG